jgi:F0F1-type ATP synthase assembly protein I
VPADGRFRRPRPINVKFFTKLGILVGASRDAGSRLPRNRMATAAGDGTGGSMQAAVLLRPTVMAKNKRGFSYERAAKSLQENASNSGAVAGASYTLVGGIILLGAIGYGVDEWRGTSPWGLMIGLALGIVVGFYELVKTAWRR